MKRLLLRGLVPLISGVLLLALMLLLYRNLDFSAFIAALAQADLGWLALLVLTILFEFLLQGWKWRQLLYELKPISSLRLASALLAGYGANVLVPLGIGPLVRAWLVARVEQLRMASVLATTAIARFVDGLVFALFAGAVALSGQVAILTGDLQVGLALAGLLNLILFSVLLWLLFRSRALLAADNALISRAIDWLASKGPASFNQMRSALAQGILWPRQLSRQLIVVFASVAAKFTAASHFVWSGLAVGVQLGIFDYLLVMVLAGFALVLARLVRLPGGFVVGSGFALMLLGVPDEQALAMILLSNVTAILVSVGLGLIILWQSGIDIRRAQQDLSGLDQSP